MIKTYYHVQAFIKVPLLKPLVFHMNVLPLNHRQYVLQKIRELSKPNKIKASGENCL